MLRRPLLVLFASFVALLATAGTAGAEIRVRISDGGAQEGAGRLVLDQYGTTPNGSVAVNLTDPMGWTFSFNSVTDVGANVGALVVVDPSASTACTPGNSGNGKTGDNMVTCTLALDPSFTMNAQPIVYLGDGSTTSSFVIDPNAIGVRLYGELGNDTLDGDLGPDTLDGGGGDDDLNGGGGGDTLVGGPGTDTVYGDDRFDPAAGTGNDTLYLRESDTDYAFCGGGADTVVADAAALEADSHFNGCETIDRPAPVDPGTPNPNPTPTPPAGSVVVDGVRFASLVEKATPIADGAVLAVAPEKSLKMPDYQRPFSSRTPAQCTTKLGGHVFCDANAVRANIAAIGVNANFVVKADPNARKNDGWAVGEVTRTVPVAGATLRDSSTSATKVTIFVFDPATPEALQNCRANQKMAPGVDTTLGQYLVGKDYATVKKELLEFECYTKAGKGVDEANVKYAIETVTDKKAKYPRVTKVADKRIDGEKFTTLIVTMSYPQSQLHLSYSTTGKAGPGLDASGQLRVDAKAKQTFEVRAYGPTGWLPPVGTEISLRDPDGELVDRGVTDPSGKATLSGFVVEAGKHELFAAVTDADGDSISGFMTINAVRSTSGPSFGRVGSRDKGAPAKGRAIPVKTSCGDGSIKDGATDVSARTAAMELVACKLNAEHFVASGIPAAVATANCAFCVISNITDAIARRSAAVQALRLYAVGENPSEVRPILLGSGTVTGKIAVGPVAPISTLALASDGQRVFETTVNNALDTTKGVVAFRVDLLGATFLPNGSILWDLPPMTVNKERVLTEIKPLTPQTLSILPLNTNLTGMSASILASGGGNVVASGGGNVLASGGGNILAAGGGNVLASGGGNVIAAGGGNILASGGGNILASGAGNVLASGGGNVIAAGGGNVLASGGGNVIAAGAGNLIAPGQAKVIAAGAGN